MYTTKSMTSPERFPDDAINEAEAGGWDLMEAPKQYVAGHEAGRPVYAWVAYFRRQTTGGRSTGSTRTESASIAHNPRSANVTHGMGGFR